MWGRAFLRASRGAAAAAAKCAAAPSACSMGRAAAGSVKQAASSGPSVFKSAAFQSFSKGMFATSSSRPAMSFAASAMPSSLPSYAPNSPGMGSSPQAGSPSVSTVDGADSDESSPTNSGSSQTSSADEEEGATKRKRTRPRARMKRRRGGAGSEEVMAWLGRPAMAPLASAHAGASALRMPAVAGAALGMQGAGARGLHTGRAALFAGPADGKDGRAAFGGGGGKPTPDAVTESLVFSKEAFMRQPMNTVAIPSTTREVMYQHRWDKLLVDVRRAVSYVRKEGQREEYTAMVAVGNMKGLFGLGLGSAPTAQEAVAAAYLDAFNKLAVIPLYRSHTIYNHIEHRYNSLKFLISPRAEGQGIVANDLLLELCNLAGIRNASVKVYGRRRPKFYVAAGFLEALQRQSVPHDGVEGSGVYVREVQRRWLQPGGGGGSNGSARV